MSGTYTGKSSCAGDGLTHDIPGPGGVYVGIFQRYIPSAASGQIYGIFKFQEYVRRSAGGISNFKARATGPVQMPCGRSGRAAAAIRVAPSTQAGTPAAPRRRYSVTE
jgi:hypothetical protein